MMDFDPFQQKDFHFVQSPSGIQATDIVWSIVFGTLTLCFVAPPVEVRSAGLTIQNMAFRWLGSEQLNFCYYHMRRIGITRFVHSCLPLLYYLYMALVAPHLQLFTLHVGRPSMLYLFLALLWPLSVGVRLIEWNRNNFAKHPVASALQLAGRGQPWRAVASSINVEFRRYDKFVSGLVGRQVIVTDSWLIVTSVYQLQVAHQSDVILTLDDAEEHHLSQEVGGQGSQFLLINVRSVHTNHVLFQIRLNALEYEDLRQKLGARLIQAQNVIVRQSLSERFVEAFRQQVASNTVYALPAEMEVEQCIGCMSVTADVKLNMMCSVDEEGPCQRCFCRPMWCLSCTARWFASRQLQDRVEPEEWMRQRAPCPTCRAIFCLLDVCPLSPSMPL